MFRDFCWFFLGCFWKKRKKEEKSQFSTTFADFKYKNVRKQHGKDGQFLRIFKEIYHEEREVNEGLKEEIRKSQG